ncbi:MAG: HEAT repeat domain-containing protein [Pseudomonadota bacterium]
MSAPLDPKQLAQFVVDGFVRVRADVAPDINATVTDKLRHVHAHEFLMGNNIMARVPELREVAEAPALAATLEQLLGPGYLLHPHRAVHLSTPCEPAEGPLDPTANAPPMGPGSLAGSIWHQDAQSPLARARHFLPRHLIVFYFPHDTPPAMGPTRIVPGSQYGASAEAPERVVMADDVRAGDLFVLHFDIVHAAFPNFTRDPRFMIKFVFSRTTAPAAQDLADWPLAEPPNAEQEWVWRWLHGASIGGGDNAAAERSQRLEAELLAVAGRGLHRRKLARDASGAPLPRDAQTRTRRWSERAVAMEPATYELAMCGPAALPALERLVANDDPWLRANAAFALGEIGEQQAQPLLVALLDDAEQVVVRQALDALAALGSVSGAEAAIEGLLRVVNTAWQAAEVMRGWCAQDQIRMNAMFALLCALERGTLAIESVENMLVHALDDDCGYVGDIAGEALCRFGTAVGMRAALRKLRGERWDASLFGIRQY